MLAAESLTSPSEGHWVSLHRNLTSSEERQLTDYIGIIDSESNHSLHTEEVMNNRLHSMYTEEKQSGQPLSMYTQAGDSPAEGSDDDLHEPDSLEELGEGIESKDVCESVINSTIVPNELQQHPSERSKTLVCDTKQLKIWYQKVWAPDSLKITMKFEPMDPEISANSLSVKLCQESEDELFPIEVRTQIFIISLQCQLLNDQLTIVHYLTYFRKVPGI